jgi:5-hydroxyisourate hydrolase
VITTHVLDTALGKPGRGIVVELERNEDDEWIRVGGGTTDDDGRCRTLTPQGPVPLGVYLIRFFTGAYQLGFFPVVEIQFTVDNGDQHYHVPLLLSPYAYSTYRGS